MYIVLIGPSGAPKKSTAINAGRRLLEEVGIHITPDSITWQALLSTLRRASELSMTYSEGDTQIRDIKMHCSITIHSREMTVFTGYDNHDFLDILGDWYDCPDQWEREIKKEGVVNIRGLWVNMLAATTPEHFRRTMPSLLIGGGFASRLVLIYEDTKARPIPFHDPTSRELQLQEDLIADLRSIRQLQGAFELTPEFIRDYSAWYLNESASPTFADPRLSPYEARRATHIRKLSMILCASRGDSMRIETRDLLRAIELLEVGEKKLPMVYRVAEAHRDYSLEQRMQAYIALQCKTQNEMPLADLVRHFQSEADNDALARAMAKLQAMQYCKIDPAPHGNIIRYLGQKQIEKGEAP